MRRIVSAIWGAALALSLLAQANPADAAAGFDSAYSGESAFLILNPGQAGTFTVFFANTGTVPWTAGTSSQVDLAVCLEDKVTCDVSDPLDAAYDNGWKSPTRYTSHAQSSVAPGQIGTFSYSVKVPPDGSGTHRFNGALVVGASVGQDVHNEGYYQDVQVVPPARGLGLTVSPSTKGTNIVSTVLGTPNGSRGLRTYTVTIGSDINPPVRITLLPAENVTIRSDGTAVFTDLDGNNKADLNCGTGNCVRWLTGAPGSPGSTTTALQAYIQEVNGTATGQTGGQLSAVEASPPSGSFDIVFTVNSQEMDQVIPVAWKDTSGDGQLDISTPPCCGAETTNVEARKATGAGAATEPVGIGGRKDWTPEQASFATYSCNVLNSDGDGRVVFVDPAAKYAVVRHNGLLRRFNWDANDQLFYVNTITANTDGPGLTTAQLEAYLSPTVQTSSSIATNLLGEDRLQIAYNPDSGAASKLTFCADRPARPASITAAVTDAPDTIAASQAECSSTPCGAGADTDGDSDDVIVTFPLTLNPCAVSYTVERRTTTDNGITFSTSEIVTVNARLKSSSDTSISVYDLNVPVGVHAWRVRANSNDPDVGTDIGAGGSSNDPECGLNAADSSYRTMSTTITVTQQPGGGGAVGGRPVSVDARMAKNVGLSQTIDAGDVFTVSFNESMDTSSSASRTIWAKDPDGTVGKILCDPTAAATAPTTEAGILLTAYCTWNTSTETIGGVPYTAGTVLSVQIVATSSPSSTTGAPVGTTPGLQIGAAVFDASGVTDTTGDIWDIARSTDLVIDNE
jgi:hypothetical protein